MAEEADVDLVEIAPNAQPPVCRLMDYGKFRYQEQKKAQEAKAKQKTIQVKEVKFRPVTDENDFQTKLRSLVRFLTDGDKAPALRHGADGPGSQRTRRNRPGRTSAQARGPADDHGARSEKEEVIR